MPRLIAFLLFILLLGLTTACATTKQDSQAHQENSSQASRVTDTSAFPRTVRHIKGETIIKSRPVRVATPYIPFVDYMAALNEYPVAAQGVSVIRANFPILSQRLGNQEILDLGMEPNLEHLMAASPDLIIAADNMQDQYDQLSQIAPTIILPQAGDWRETLKKIGESTGKEQEAEHVLAEFDRKSAEYKQQLAFRSNESVMFTMYNGKNTFVAWNDERFDPFYNGLGLKQVDGGKETSGNVSLEGLAKLDPDHLFVINNWQSPVEGGVQQALQDSRVWNQMKAVRNHHVYYLDDPSLPGPMALAKIQGIEDIMKAMGDHR